MPQHSYPGLRTRFVAADARTHAAAEPLVAVLVRRLEAEGLRLPRALVIVGHEQNRPDYAGQLVMRKRVAWIWIKAGSDHDRLPALIAHELGHLAMNAAADFAPQPAEAVGQQVGGEWMAELVCGEFLAELGLRAGPFDLDDRAAYAFRRWTYLQGRARSILLGTADSAEREQFRTGLVAVTRMWAYAHGRRTFADPTERGDMAKSPGDITRWIRSRPLLGRLIAPLARAGVRPTLIERNAAIVRAGARFDAILADVASPTAAEEFLCGLAQAGIRVVPLQPGQVTTERG
jgi:hypothetical protein